VLVQTGKFRADAFARAPRKPSRVARDLMDAVERGFLG